MNAEINLSEKNGVLSTEYDYYNPPYARILEHLISNGAEPKN